VRLGRPTTPLNLDGAITLLSFFVNSFIFEPMQRTAYSSPIGSSDLETDPIFNVVIAYEDFETGKQAKETYDFLANNLRDECRFENQMWKFDVLGIPKLRDMAAKDALVADIIIISCHGTHDLSIDVKAWMNAWVQSQSSAIALVALFGNACDDRENKAILDYLAGIARCAGMEFFAQPSDLAVKRFDQSIVSDRAAKWDERALSALAGVVQRDQTFPHWGLNE
jgi:hypothetical protein